MRVPKSLRDVCRELLSALEVRHRKTVMSMVVASFSARCVTVTGLGRHLERGAMTKHRIKRVSRAVGNPHLQKQVLPVYVAGAQLVLAQVNRPVLLLDWTDDGGVCRLSCSVVHEGRSLPLYQEVHPQTNTAVETSFVRTLKEKVVPRHCRPILVTDAGFRTPFFRVVAEVGWYFVGRMQPTVHLQSVQATSSIWWEASSFHLTHTSSIPPTAHGRYRFPKGAKAKDRCCARLVTFKGGGDRAKSQERKGPPETRRKADQQYRRQHRAGWVLVTNLSEEEAGPACVASLYATRMQCEQLFRDDKSGGLQMRQAKPQPPERRPVLHLIGTLNHLVCRLAGVIAENLGLARHYQANTTRDRRVLSLTRLGREVLRDQDHRIFSKARVQHALRLCSRAAEACLFPL